MKSVRQLEEELKKVRSKIEAYQHREDYALKKLKLKARELKDQVKYSIGGQILDSDFCNIFPGAREWLYQNAITRDKKKYVELGFVEGDSEELKRLNIQECQESARAAGIDTDLTEKEIEQISISLSAMPQKIYGRAGELYVYHGANNKFYISDNVAKYLQKKEGFRA